MFFAPHIDLLPFLIKLSKNRLFIKMSRFLCMSLVTISAVSFHGIWIKPISPFSPACTMGKWICYYGKPLSFLEMVFQFDVQPMTIILPIFVLLEAIILLFRPSWTYLFLNILNLLSFIFSTFFHSDRYDQYLNGTGYWLFFAATSFLFFFTFSMLLVEWRTRKEKEDAWALPETLNG